MKKIYLFLIVIISFSSFSQGYPNVSITPPNFQGLCNGGCATMTLDLRNVNETTDYQVINNLNSFHLVSPTATLLPNNFGEDIWSSPINLPFPFCFYGETYTTLYVGSNGVITFNPVTPLVVGECKYMFSTAVPDTNFPIKNAIYGVYQDTNFTANAITNPDTQRVSYFVQGTTPNRSMIITFNELPLYLCGDSAGLQSSQVILYEGSNIIAINVKKRTPCNTWNNGNGVIGIQNAAGTMAKTPANRNTGNWSAEAESWHFRPIGNAIVPTSYTWKKNGEILVSETSNTLTICPSESTTDFYELFANYTSCGNSQIASTEFTLGTPDLLLPTAEPYDISICSNEPTAVFNINMDEYLINNNAPTFYYKVSYYETFEDADYATNNDIENTTDFVAADGKVIYVRVEDIGGLYGCYYVKSFTLHINPFPDAPVAEPTQVFTAGETLADLEISGDNILWYATETGGEPLPAFTVLVHATTYYATQTNTSGCESARMLQTRFPVIVYDEALSNAQWKLSRLIVEPNPVQNIVNIKSANTLNSVSVYNLIGQQVFSKTLNANSAQLNLEHLSAGTYLMKIASDNQIKTVKIIRQ